MIARVVATVAMSREPDDETALAIELAQLVEATHSLPHAGGILDQDAYLMRLVRDGLEGLAQGRKILEDRKTPAHLRGR